MDLPKTIILQDSTIHELSIKLLQEEISRLKVPEIIAAKSEVTSEFKSDAITHDALLLSNLKPCMFCAITPKLLD